VVDTPLQNPPELRAGRRLANRYRLERPLANGGMAAVWLATDEQLRRPVAVKVLHEHLRDPHSRERFRGEGKLAAQLSHPAIVAIYDTFHDRGIDGIVLEYVDGPTLRTRLDDGTPLPTADAVAVAAQVADALAEAHRRGLVHRDIKPANILLGTRGTAKLTDFGIAKLLDGTDLTLPGTFVGTAKYLAPEQVTGEPVDGRADVYALGIVLYEMLAGRVPFLADNDAATALARLQLPAPALHRVRSDLPPALCDLVDRMLDRAPARRPDPAAVAAALSAHAGAARDHPTDTGAPGPTPTAPRRRAPVALAVVGVVVVAALVVAAVLVGRTDAGARLRDRLGLGGGSSPTATVAVPLDTATLQSFDPGSADRVEHDDLLPFVHDGNPLTVWTTEKYADRDFGGLKDGVGIIVDLGRSTTLQEVRVQSASTGWSAALYVADGAPDAIERWGTAQAGHTDIAREATFTFSPTRGRTVLLWITDLGDAAQVRIGELELRRPA
jgi:eukaryotic-like serine/threonine-protein kinase